MTISNSLAISLSEVFRFRETVNSTYHPKKHGVSLVCHEVGGRLVVPAIGNEYLAATVFQHSNANNIVIPLFDNGCRDTKKTSDSIINVFFNQARRSSYNCNCVIIDTTKGYKYIGGKGYILTEDGKPLIICGYEVKSGFDPTYRFPVCVINPEVFQREDMVSKCIVKKIIPYYSEHDVYTGSSILNQTTSSHRVRIVITPEINNLVHKAVEPIRLDVTDDLYAILEANMESVVR